MGKFDILKEKFNALSKKQKIALIVLVFIVFPILANISAPKIETGYTRVAEKVCSSENQCVEYKMFEPISVSKKTSDTYTVYKISEYNAPKPIGEISAKNVVFKGTPEYEQTKQEKADIEKKAAELAKAIEEKLKKERQEELAKLEPTMKKAYYKIEIKQFKEDGSGFYNFYVNPTIWFKLKYDEKQNAFKNCVKYAQLKTNPTNSDSIKFGTKIKSSSNAVVLAEYDTFKGIKVK